MLATLAGAMLAVGAASTVAIEHGLVRPGLLTGDAQASMGWFTGARLALAWLALIVANDVRPWGGIPQRWSSAFGRIGEPVLAASAIAELAGLWAATELASVALAVALACRLNGRLARWLRNPSMLFPGSFVAVIAVSTGLLKLPAATPPGQPISWIDALFTATSAVCVTGLGVRDTATGFTLFGQGVILGSIQVGGLGVMIFGSTFALLFGARLSVRENLTLSAALSEYPAHQMSRFVWFIVLTTLGIQALGAGLTFAMWPPTPDLEPGQRAWLAVFHSVSAFCNAGFDITSQSMVGLRSHPIPYVVMAPLIILGGLGFVVIEDVARVVRSRVRGVRPRRRLSTHSRLVLATSGWLLIGGTVLLFVSQAATSGEGIGQQALDAVFMSVTSRTAGFSSVPMEDLSAGSRLTLMLLMCVGGSPSSTAGGMKTVALAVLVLAVVATAKGREEVEVFGRALPDSLVRRAATVAVGMVAVIVGAMLVLDLTEAIAFEPLLFEVISAVSTTGLSLGATAELSPFGRVALSAVMFMGRIGPLAVIASIVAGPSSGRSYRLPRDTVSLG